MSAIKSLTVSFIVIFCTWMGQAQNNSDTLFNDMGVSVSPSSLHVSVKPGESLTKDIRVKNDTRIKYSFQVGFSDFEMTSAGKPMAMKPEQSKYALSKWITVSPSFFELEPGEEIKLKAIISVPDDPEAAIAAWTIITVEQVAERPPLDNADHPKRLTLGVIPTFGFGIYVYQNPPNVKVNKLDITSMKYDEVTKSVKMTVKNTGDGIGYSTSYLELTNLKTGEQKKLQVKRFTILPQYVREFSYDLGSDILPGKYSAVGVIDYGSKEELIAAELEFEIK